MILRLVKNFKFWVVLMIVAFCIILLRHRVNKGQELQQDMTPPVLVSQASLGSVVHYINAIGTVKARDSVELKAEVDGKISKIRFAEGTRVKEGDLLLELDSSKAKAELMEDEAMYRRTRSEFEPINKLASKGVAARIERDKKQAEMESYAARVESKKATLAKHSISAPFDGTVGLKNVSVGQFVSPGTPLLKIVSLQSLKIDFKIAEDKIGEIYVGQPVDVYLGGDETQTYTAKVIAIDPETEAASHSFIVRAELDVPDVSIDKLPDLKPGRFATVRIALDTEEKGILIPESAIEGIGENKTVYVVKDGLAIRTPVTTGVRKGGNVEILTGVNEGDVVVTAGNANVIDGKPVSIQKNFSADDITKLLKERYAGKSPSAPQTQKKAQTKANEKK